ncbi:hypothetical protein [Pedobacter mucosus]|uniref:hypothetical protein n=1 Tax=Pedobacter mucosus TaxID=2895286 RepID=UPI001EE48BDB|nr:hypothetical protein [Pedobacter mucosus]UKT64289.1 hypothetical protein LOK61_00590 [Pedobacter mucosus]
MDRKLIFKDGTSISISLLVANQIRDKFTSNSSEKFILTRNEKGDLLMYIELSEIRCIVLQDESVVSEKMKLVVNG